MDRRRYIPGPESMEGRMMLSTAAAPSAITTTTDPNLPYTIQQKLERIDRIPINLRATSPNRVLPESLITPIQDGMRETLSSLHAADPASIKVFNNVLRDVVSRPSLRAQDARALNNALTKVLVSAGATTDEVDKIAGNLQALATTVNTAQGNPVFITTNDYATVLQMTLIVGQPMPAPTVPTIARDSGTSSDATHFVSRTTLPTFLGTYEARAQIQMFDDATGQVYGQAPTDNQGRYKITFTEPVEVGTHHIRIRAVDELGHVGKASRPFTLKVVEPRGR